MRYVQLDYFVVSEAMLDNSFRAAQFLESDDEVWAR